VSNRNGWIAASVLTLALASFAAYIANALRFVDCANEASSECSTPGLVQLVIALAGLAPALLMLIQSARGRGRPGVWFILTALVYAVWLLIAWREFG
jgi:uncharacterized membrane protein YhaH (DUF805 family)